jgi:hypothetical protein
MNECQSSALRSIHEDRWAGVRRGRLRLICWAAFDLLTTTTEEQEHRHRRHPPDSAEKGEISHHHTRILAGRQELLKTKMVTRRSEKKDQKTLDKFGEAISGSAAVFA